VPLFAEPGLAVRGWDTALDGGVAFGNGLDGTGFLLGVITKGAFRGLEPGTGSSSVGIGASGGDSLRSDVCVSPDAVPLFPASGALLGWTGGCLFRRRFSSSFRASWPNTAGEADRISVEAQMICKHLVFIIRSRSVLLCRLWWCWYQKIKVTMDATLPLEIVAIHRFEATSAWRFLPAINPMDPPHAKARRGIREGFRSEGSGDPW
jgi:hypothetical protein